MTASCERLESLRSEGGDAFDGPGFRFIEGLLRRAGGLDGAAAARLSMRATHSSHAWRAFSILRKVGVSRCFSSFLTADDFGPFSSRAVSTIVSSSCSRRSSMSNFVMHFIIALMAGFGFFL